MNDSTAQLLSNCTPYARCCVLGARGVVLTYEAISFLAGVSGNCLLLYSVLVSRVKPGILAHLLSIVAANFTAMSVWPMHVDYYRTGARWRFGLAGCAATRLVDQGCEYVAFYHSHSIAMTLYLKIVHEVALVDTACFIVARTAVVWVVVPSVMLLNVHLGRSKVAYDPAERTCDTLAAQDALLRAESPARTGLMLLAVFYCYSHIVHKVRRSGASVHGSCKPCRELAITKMFVANFVILLVGHVPGARQARLHEALGTEGAVRRRWATIDGSRNVFRFISVCCECGTGTAPAVLKMLRGDNGAGCQALASASLQRLHVVLSPAALVVVNTEMRAACGRLLQAGLRRLRAEHTTSSSLSTSITPPSNLCT
ncbi:unnamed protein product [Lampetra fluviatilis]